MQNYNIVSSRPEITHPWIPQPSHIGSTPNKNHYDCCTHRSRKEKKNPSCTKLEVRTIQHSKGTEINWRERERERNGGKKTSWTDVHKDASSEIGVESGSFSL